MVKKILYKSEKEYIDMAKLRKMLGSAESPYIVSLMKLIETQSKTTITKWCVDYAEEHILHIYENAYAEDLRPRNALKASREYIEGKIKLVDAKKLLREASAAGREAEGNPIAQAAARAVAQAAATINTSTNSLAVAFYGSAAIAYARVGTTETTEVYEQIAAEECGKMEEALRLVAVENEENPAKINWNC